VGVKCGGQLERALCATVFYTKRIGGRLYPRAARTGPYAFAEEVSRVNGKVVSKYLGIRRLPDAPDVIEIEEDADDHHFSEPEQI
jgi:hypothetical protein